jgi:hypothetical protein
VRNDSLGFVFGLGLEKDSSIEVMNARSTSSRPSSSSTSVTSSLLVGQCGLSQSSLSDSRAHCCSSSILCSLRNSSISLSWAHSGSVLSVKRFTSSCCSASESRSLFRSCCLDCCLHLLDHHLILP